MVFIRRITQSHPGVAGRGHGKECPYCRRTMDRHEEAFDLRPTRDHYPVPKSQGGNKTIISCYRCNHTKRDMSAEAWSAYMVEHPEWWLEERGRPSKRKEAKEAKRTAKWGPRGARVIRQPEKPSTPMAEPLMALKLARMIGQEFDRKFGGES